MKEKYFKNSIISFFLIISFVFMPLSLLPKKAEAQGINSRIGGISTIAGQLPMCKSISSLKGLFTQGADIEKALVKDIAPKVPVLADEVADDVSSSGSVPVDVGPQIKEDTAAAKDAAQKTQDDMTKLTNNDTCLKSIGRVIIKMLLQKITTDTVKWINKGMNGSPLFVQDPGGYFEDITKTEILGLNGEINNTTLYPFAKGFIKAEANSYKSKFANNAAYTLDKTIRDTNPESEFTAQTFSNDFSQGGWAAWDAMSQNAANNPLGFTLMASDELTQRIEKSTGLAAGSLQQSGGYFGVDKCTLSDPKGAQKGLTHTKSEANVAKRASDASLNVAPGNATAPICKSWSLVTPGGMVAAAAIKLVSYPDNNLLKADDLNDAVAAILDAFANHYATQFMGKDGLFGLSDSSEFKAGEQGDFVMNYDNATDYETPQTTKDFSDFAIASSTFLTQNPNFNIRTDLNQAVIDEQTIYIDKLIRENKELKSTVTPNDNMNIDFASGYTGNYGLIPTIYQLDYCLPGPHPGFEADSQASLSAALGVIVPETIDSVHNKTADEVMGAVQDVATLALAVTGAIIGASVGSTVPIVGTIIGAAGGILVGLVVSWVRSIIANTDDNKVRSYYGGQMYNLTGNRVMVEDSVAKKVPALYDKGPFSDALSTVLDRYINIVHDVYDPSKMPTVTKEAAAKFLETPGYNKIFSDNENKITSMQGIIKRLTEIKKEVDILNDQLAKQTITDANGAIAPADDVLDSLGNILTMGQKNQYEENLKQWSDAFGRLSQSMVTADDIASADSLTKQVIAEKDYVYKNLLKGPNGCEKDNVSSRPNGGLPWQVYDTKRMEYPGPILYDYNNFAGKAELPDPFKSGYKNIMPYLDQKNGPGFLSYVNFETKQNWCGDNYPKDHIQNPAMPGELHAPLCLHDLYELRNLWPPSIGKSSGGPPEFTTGIFEGVIGVY